MTDRSHPAIPCFVEPPEGWHKNPDCDLHGPHVYDLLTRVTDDDTVAAIDVAYIPNPDGYHKVMLNAGLRGNTGPEDYDHIETSLDRVQQAVDLLARRADLRDGVIEE